MVSVTRPIMHAQRVVAIMQKDVALDKVNEKKDARVL